MDAVRFQHPRVSMASLDDWQEAEVAVRMDWILPSSSTELATWTPKQLAVAQRVVERYPQWVAKVGVENAPAPLFWWNLAKDPAGFPGERFDITVNRLQDDPLWKAGKGSVPPDVWEKLQLLQQHAVEVDEMLIVHELPPGTIEKYGGVKQIPPAMLAPQPTAKQVQQSQRWGNAVEKTSRALTVAGDVMGMALAAPFLLAATAGLDPALVGAICPSGKPRPGDPAFLFLIAAWVY